MTYLFWAFAAVWAGVFLYLYGLVRRSRLLEQQLEDLVRQRGPAGGGTGAPAGEAPGAEERVGTPRP